MKRIFQNPKHWLYIVSHLLMMVAGFLLCKLGPNTVWVAVGGSLIAAGLAGWVVFAYVLVSEEVSAHLDVLSKFGVENVFEARSVVIKQEYVRRLNAAREAIDVIGFGLSAFRQDFVDDLARWRERATIRILLIDPEFPNADQTYAAQRDREEKNPSGNIATEVKKFVEDVGRLIGKFGGHSLEIRLYRCLPTLNILRIDDELFWGPYLVGEQSRNSPTFLVKRGGILFDRFSQQFERIWNNDQLSRPVPVKWLANTQ